MAELITCPRCRTNVRLYPVSGRIMAHPDPTDGNHICYASDKLPGVVIDEQEAHRRRIAAVAKEL